jgi:hypothetical protein
MAKPETEGAEKRARHHALPLSDRAVDLIRRTANYTGLAIQEIKATIGASRALDDLVEKGCASIVEGREKQRAAEKAAIFEKEPGRREARAT